MGVLYLYQFEFMEILGILRFSTQIFNIFENLKPIELVCRQVFSTSY